MKILVFTYWDNRSKDKYSFKDIGLLTNPSKEEYCKKWNYDFEYFEIDKYDKEIGWFKIETIKRKLESGYYSWVFYVEADAMIMNHTIDLNSILDNNYDIVLAKNSISKGWEGLNCGVISVRNSEWSIKFLEKLLNKKEFWHNNQAEQAAIIDEFNNNEKEMLEHIKILNSRTINAYYHLWYPKDNFAMGDFILHDAGAHNSHRFELFTELKDKIIKEENSELLKYNIKTPLMI